MKKAVHIPTCSSVFMYDTATQHTMPVHRQLIHSNVNNHRLAQIDTICTKHTFTSSANSILNMNIVLCYSVDVRKGTKKWCMNTCGNEWPNMLHTHGSTYSHLFHHPRDGHIKMHNLYDRPHWHDLQGRSWQLCPYFLLLQQKCTQEWNLIKLQLQLYKKKKKIKLDKLQDMVLYWKLRGQADKGTVFTQFNHKLYCNAIAIFMVRKKKNANSWL